MPALLAEVGSAALPLEWFSAAKIGRKFGTAKGNAYFLLKKNANI
jgi:hypothetical protein